MNRARKFIAFALLLIWPLLSAASVMAGLVLPATANGQTALRECCEPAATPCAARAPTGDTQPTHACAKCLACFAGLIVPTTTGVPVGHDLTGHPLATTPLIPPSRDAHDLWRPPRLS